MLQNIPEQHRLVGTVYVAESREADRIDEIARTVESMDSIALINVEPVRFAGRTRIVFAGPSEAVSEAVHQLADSAYGCIDMRNHPTPEFVRGALDSVSLMPFRTAKLRVATRLADRVARVLGEKHRIPVYVFGAGAKRKKRREFSNYHNISYTGLKGFIKSDEGTPDFGEARYSRKFGASVVAGRLCRLTVAIYFDTREIDLLQSLLNYNAVGSANGESTNNAERTIERISNIDRISEILKHIRAMVDTMTEHRTVRMQIVIPDYSLVGLASVIDEIRIGLEEVNVGISGIKMIGHVPAEPLIAAGKYFAKEKSEAEVDDNLRHITRAVQSLRLSSLESFNLSERVLDYRFT